MNVLLKGKFDPAIVESLKKSLGSGWEVAVSERPRFAEQLAEAEVVITGSWEADLPPAPKLQLLQIPWTGFDAVDLKALPEGVRVCNVFEHEAPMAEYCVLAMLEWCVGLRKMDTDLRKGKWALGFKKHERLQGKTVGLIGYGHIAKEVIRRLEPFGVRVAVRTRTVPKEHPGVADMGSLEDLNTLLAQSDFLVVACPLNDQSRGLLGKAQFERMKPTSVVVNVARGAILVERDFYEALRDGEIGGAVIDTWYDYPPWGSDKPHWPSKHPFWELDNVIMSPHASAVTPGLDEARWEIVADNLRRLKAGKPLLNEVRK